MYFAAVALLLFVLPAASVAAEASTSTPLTAGLACKWYAFWAVGVRLALAGFTQVTRPRVRAPTRPPRLHAWRRPATRPPACRP